MHIVIVTGMSGAGKTTVLKILENAGYHCVDNLPPALIGSFAELCLKPDTGITQAALGIDIRGGIMFSDFFTGLDSLKNLGLTYSILFLDAANDILLNRYKETRHLHPLAKDGLVSVGITKERAQLEEVRAKASYILDTSFLLPRQLKIKIHDIFSKDAEFNQFKVNVISFGFKNGIPNEADLVFDVRFLPNPFYDPELKPQSGLDPDVRDFVLRHEITARFMESLLNMLHMLIPHYIAEGKNQLIVGIGCTGGRHRSVALAQDLHRALTQRDQTADVVHRDIHREEYRKEAQKKD
ncbi:MAG: RNase adapter RapZ [Defluviitaleaceae bacterium]|nr:RNase adapter RapZ [Defluviitaleaceae bacterium]